MNTYGFTRIFTKALALACCVPLLLLSTSSQAFCLNLDCAPAGGLDSSCCCTPLVEENEQGSCCESIHPGLTHLPGDIRPNSELDPCCCIIVPVGSDFAPFISSVPSTLDGPTHHPLEKALCPPADLLVRVGWTAADHNTSCPLIAADILDTVVLQL
jgi:hypothetical protein